MRIGIIGSGNMGKALGTTWARAGHEVLFSYSRYPQKLEQLAKDAGHGAVAGTVAEAAAADVVLLAVLWHTLDDVLAQVGSMEGKTLLSCTMPMNEDDSELVIGFDSSGSEFLAKKTGANVVSLFNSVWAEVIEARMTSQEPAPAVLYVGDDLHSKATAAQLIRDAHFEPVDAGPLADARLLEPFGFLIGKLGFANGPLTTAYRFVNP